MPFLENNVCKKNNVKNVTHFLIYLKITDNIFCVLCVSSGMVGSGNIFSFRQKRSLLVVELRYTALRTASLAEARNSSLIYFASYQFI